MTFGQFRFLVRSDLHCYTGRTSASILVRQFLATPGFRYTLLLRLSAWLAHTPGRYGLRQLVTFWMSRQGVRHGISIPYDTRIGPGFYIGHSGGIVVNERTVIGKNCNISHGVTLGQVNRGERIGCPEIGDHVYIGPGAKLFGRIRIGNHAAVGANAVVNRDVPDSGVAVGVPAKVVSDKGSAGYINRTDYE